MNGEQLFALFALLCCIGIIGLVQERYRSLRMTLLSVFGLLYPVGESFQRFSFAPWYVTSYLSDLGFIPFFSMGAVILFSKSKSVSLIKQVSIVTFLIISALELVQLYFNKPADTNLYIGDLWDIVCYMIGLGLTLIVVHSFNYKKDS